MIIKHGAAPYSAGAAVRVGFTAHQANLDLLADARNGVAVETGLRQGQTKQAYGFMSILAEGLEAAAQGFQPGGEAKTDGVVLQLALKRLTIQCARAFVQQA